MSISIQCYTSSLLHFKGKYCTFLHLIYLTANKDLTSFQTDIKELVAMKANCCVASQHLFLVYKVEPEHTAKTTSDGQLACMFCAYFLRGNNSLCQQAAVVCMRHSKKGKLED